MESGDRTEFDAQLAILCAGYDKPVGDRGEAYWKGLHRMGLIEFARCVEHAVSEQGPEKFPTTHAIWDIARALKSRGRATSTAVAVPEDPRDHLLFYANRMFLRHMITRGGLGSTGRFIPAHGMVDVQASPELIAARQFVRKLVDWWSEPIRESDPDATHAEFIRQFTEGLDKISPLASATRREWEKRQRELSPRDIFPPHMGRELEPKYQSRQQQLALPG